MEGANNFVLQDAYSKLKKSEALEAYERAALEKFTDAFVTCTRCVGAVSYTHLPLPTTPYV